jgi:hypothetical protein
MALIPVAAGAPGHRKIQNTTRYATLAPDRFNRFWKDQVCGGFRCWPLCSFYCELLPMVYSLNPKGPVLLVVR